MKLSNLSINDVTKYFTTLSIPTGLPRRFFFNARALVILFQGLRS